MKSLYFDHGATTPLRREVLESMVRAMKETFANPGSLHDPGQQAFELTEEARFEVAQSIGGSPREILFTGGEVKPIIWPSWGRPANIVNKEIM